MKRGPMSAKPIPRPIDADRERFFKMVEKTEGCWWFIGHRSPLGYGQFWLGGALRLAHRASLAIHGIDIPEGKVVDHICKQRGCVRPSHLQFVSQDYNCTGPTAESPFAKNRRKVACPQGHLYTPENTAAPLRKGRPHGRICLTCFPTQWRWAVVPRPRPPGSRVKKTDPDYAK